MNKNILVIQGVGRAKGNTARLVESFKAGAEESGHSVEVVSLLRNEVKGCLGCNACRYGKPCVQKDAFHDLVPKIKAADCIVFASPLYFWTFEQAVSYYQFALVNYIGFRDRGMVLAGGCGDTNGRPQIDKTEYLQKAYKFGKFIYEE